MGRSKEKIIYDGNQLFIPGLPTRQDLVMRDDTQKTQRKLYKQLDNVKPIEFMPNDVCDHHEYANGTPIYKLYLFGVLSTGEKAHVIIDNIDIFFDIKIPPTMPLDKLKDGLEQLLSSSNIYIHRSEVIQAYPAMKFQQKKADWVRLYFQNLKDRKQAINLVHEGGYEITSEYIQNQGHHTAYDKKSKYYRAVGSYYKLVFTDWCTLSNYTHSFGGTDNYSRPRSPLCRHVLRVDINNIKSINPTNDMTVATKCTLPRSKILVMTWDIETYDRKHRATVPRADDDNTCVFIICMSLHWKDEAKALERICLVDVDIPSDKRWTTIVCGTEDNIIKAFALTFQAFAPDIITGFNDGDYDWPYIIKTAQQYSLLSFMAEKMSAIYRANHTEEGVGKWNIENNMIKIDPSESACVITLKFPGVIPVDTRVMFRQLFPKSEVVKKSSLNLS